MFIIFLLILANLTSKHFLKKKIINNKKSKLVKLYGINQNKIFICNPSLNFDTNYSYNDYVTQDFVLFYPSVPRVLKNIHLVCEAIDKINKYTRHNLILQITLNGTENDYAKYLKNKYSKNTYIQFLGIIDRKDVFNYISKCNSIIFASEFETWGLPISESKFYNKHIFVLDQEYAHETIADYKKVNFFTKDNICKVLLNTLNGKIAYSTNNFIMSSNYNFIDIFKTIH